MHPPATDGSAGDTSQLLAITDHQTHAPTDPYNRRPPAKDGRAEDTSQLLTPTDHQTHRLTGPAATHLRQTGVLETRASY